MTWGAIGAAGVSLVGGKLLSGGSGGSGNTIPAYQPTGQRGADTQLQGMFNNYTNPYGAVSPYNSSYLTASQNNPYSAGYQQSANDAGNFYNTLGYVQSGAGNQYMNAGGQGLGQVTNLLGSMNQLGGYTQNMVNGAQAGGNALSQQGSNSIGYANALPGQAQGALGGLQGLAQGYADPLQNYASMTAGRLPGLAQSLTAGIMPAAQSQYGSLIGAGNQVLNSAFDPQNQLYGQAFQQNRDQTRAALASRGLNMSGTGAGIENQSNQQFNTNWQNQQLARQQAGLQSYQGAAGQALGGLESGATSAYNPVAASLGQGLSALNTSANTGYGLQSGAAGQYLSGMQSAYGAADQLGTSGANNIINGAAAPYNALSGAITNYAGNLNQLGQAGNSFGGLTSGGSALNQQAGTNFQNAGAIPYQASQNILGNQYGGLSNYQNLAGQGLGYDNTQMTQLLAYLGYGNSAANSGNYGQAQGFNQNQTNMNNIGQLIGGVAGNGNVQNAFSNYFRPQSGGYSSGNQFSNVGINW